MELLEVELIAFGSGLENGNLRAFVSWLDTFVAFTFAVLFNVHKIKESFQFDGTLKESWNIDMYITTEHKFECLTKGYKDDVVGRAPVLNLDPLWLTSWTESTLLLTLGVFF